MRDASTRSILGASLFVAALVTMVMAHDETWKAPPEEAARKNPVPDTPQNRAKGRALYQKHCAMCHGDKGKGDGPAGKFNALPPHDLTDPELQQRMTDGEILWKLTEGRKQDEEIVMPSMREKVPEETDRWKLVLFVRSLTSQRSRVSSTLPPRLEVDHDMGEGLGKGLDQSHQLAVADSLVVLLWPEDAPAEGTSLGESAVRDNFHVIVIADKDTIVLRCQLEVDCVRGACG